MRETLIRALSSKVSPAVYIVVAASFVTAFFTIFAGPVYYLVLGILLALSSGLCYYGLKTERAGLVRATSMSSFVNWLFITIFVLLSGDLTSLFVITIPFILHFAYIYLAVTVDSLWITY